MYVEIDDKMSEDVVREKISRVVWDVHSDDWQKKKEQALDALFNSKTFDEDPLLIQQHMRAWRNVIFW